MKKLAIALVATLASIGAQAQMYGEVGYTSLTAKDNLFGFGIKASPSALRGFIGYEINQNLAVEGMVAVGLSDSTIKIDGVNIPGATLELNNAFGLYLKPKTKLNENVELFGRVGFANLKGTTTVAGEGTESNSDSSFSYGAGLSYAINPTTSINADYMQYLSKDGFKVNGFTFGLGFKF